MTIAFCKKSDLCRWSFKKHLQKTNLRMNKINNALQCRKYISKYLPKNSALLLRFSQVLTGVMLGKF